MTMDPPYLNGPTHPYNCENCGDPLGDGEKYLCSWCIENQNETDMENLDPEPPREIDIDGFILAFPPAMVHEFLHGFCYWFAFILSERFRGSIEYNPVLNHFATKVGDDLWDASGKVIGGGFEPWDAYKRIDPIHTQRIERDCIHLIGRRIDGHV